MLNVRTGTPVDAHARQIANDLRSRITAHPLCAHLTGTIIIGTAGTRLIRADDVRPRVIVPLPDLHPLNALAGAHLTQCDCVVVRDVAEAARVAMFIGRAPVVVAEEPQASAYTRFLIGADATEAAAAWDAVDENAALRDALAARGRARDERSHDQHALIAEAVMEAVVVCDAGTRGSFEPGTRG